MIIIAVFSMNCIVAYGQSVELPVNVTTDDGVKLYGSMVLPSVDQDSACTVAILIAGSGPTDRNGNSPFMQNNSLMMVAEELAKNGIASIRYDKRGVRRSQYSEMDESLLTLELYANDVLKWIKLAKSDMRFCKVVLIGHSEGAKLAMMAQNSGAEASGIVLLAGAGRNLDVILKEQLADQPKVVKDLSYAIVDSLKKGKIYGEVPVYLNSIFRPSVQPFIMGSMRIDPSELIASINVPLLVVQGDTDIQISTRDAMMLSAANHDAELVIIPSMNHVLKDCKVMDKAEQLSTYSNPSLPLHDKLVGRLVEFIQRL